MPTKTSTQKPGSGRRRHKRREVRVAGRANRLRFVRAAALLACCAAAALLGLLCSELVLRVLHFAFWPFAVLVVVFGLSAVCGALVGLWQAAAGPYRRQALGWAAVSLVPIMAVGAPLVYASAEWSRREAPRNLPMNLAKAFAASLMEGEVAYGYPYRIETPHVVMFYDRLASAREDADAAEAHVKTLAHLLGIRLRSPIDWVRGPLLGQSRVSIYGLALGTTEIVEASTEGSPDKHELAHAVIAQQEPFGSDPPTLLIEGWAASQAGNSSASLARAALEARDAEGARSLRDLTSARWYHRDDGVVYPVGGALVDFLLRRYGARRFLRLYDDARPGRFDQACGSALGVRLDNLESEFWADAQRQAKTEP